MVFTPEVKSRGGGCCGGDGIGGDVSIKEWSKNRVRVGGTPGTETRQFKEVGTGGSGGER